MNEKKEEFLRKQLNALIAINLKMLLGERDLSKRKGKKGTGDSVLYLSEFGLMAEDIATILGSPLQSVRTLLTPERKKRYAPSKNSRLQVDRKNLKEA